MGKGYFFGKIIQVVLLVLLLLGVVGGRDSSATSGSRTTEPVWEAETDKTDRVGEAESETAPSTDVPEAKTESVVLMQDEPEKGGEQKIPQGLLDEIAGMLAVGKDPAILTMF